MAKNTGSIAVALVVGAAIGFAGGYSIKPKGSEVRAPSQPSAARPADAAAARAAAPEADPIYTVHFDDFQPTKGPKDAKVTIIEVSDFECPFCNRVQPTIQQILDTYKDDVRLVWANNPLGFHRNALPA